MQVLGNMNFPFFLMKKEPRRLLIAITKIEDIQSIKSVGEYKDTVRAVQVSIAGPCPICEEDCNYNGDKYVTVKIGTQCWFAENLRTNKKPNGELLTLGTDYYCYADGPNNDPDCATSTSGKTDADGDKYGVLYNWATAMNLPATCNEADCQDPIPTTAELQGICPRGWHIPRRTEWDDYLPSTVPPKFGRVLAGYYNPNTVPPLSFSLRDSRGFFLASDESSLLSNLYVILENDYKLNLTLFYDKKMGSSVRCLKNN